MWVLVRRRDRFLERGVIFGQGGKKVFDGVILFKEYFDVLGEYLCGVKTERGVWMGLWCMELNINFVGVMRKCVYMTIAVLMLVMVENW